MKKTVLSILLAGQLILSLATVGFAATDQVTYHIGGISPVGYLLDDDTSRVDFRDSADDHFYIQYGETLYFPLLNNGAVLSASESQLQARAQQLADEREADQAYLDSLAGDLETAQRNLNNAINAALLSRGLISADINSLLTAIEAETGTDPEKIAAQIAELREDLARQQEKLDQALALDSAAQQASKQAQEAVSLAEAELAVLLDLAPAVQQRDQLKAQHEALEEAILDSGALLEDAEDEMQDASVTTASLETDRDALAKQIRETDEQIDDLLSALPDPILPGRSSSEYFESSYQDYLDARETFLLLLNEGALDSGVGDYLDDPAPDSDNYERETTDYGDAIRLLLSDFLGIGDCGRDGVVPARQLASVLEETGPADAEPDPDGPLYARLEYLLGQKKAVDEQLLLSRRRDAIASGLEDLIAEQQEVAEQIADLDQQIADLTQQVPSLSLDPQQLESDELGDPGDSWEESSLIGEQRDHIFDLQEEYDARKAEQADTQADLEEEQSVYHEISSRLAALTDPDAPSALTRATRLRQNYPFLAFSDRFRAVSSLDDLADGEVIGELEDLFDLFVNPISEADQAPESGSKFLEALRPYPSYLAAEEAYSYQLPRSAELARSADAAALAYQQAADGNPYPYVYENKAVDGVKLKSSWEEGKSYVDEILLVKKRYQNDDSYTGEIPSDYIYFVALKLKERDTTSPNPAELFGTISMRKSSRSDSLNQFDYEDVELEINLEIGYNHPEDTNLIPIEPATFYPDEDFDENDEESFDFEADGDSFYLADTRSQKKLVLGMNTDYDEEIGERYAPQTETLFFWNGNGGSFNRTGYLYLAAPEDSFLYRVDEDGDLSPVDAEYDDSEECFVIRTRTIGRYVVSEVELDLITPYEEDPEEQVVVVITPEESEPSPPVYTPPSPSPGWSQGSRSDEEEAPVSAPESEPSAPEPVSSSQQEPASSAPEELPAAAAATDISLPLLIGLSVAGALVLTLTVFLIIGAKSGKFRKQ